MLVEFTVADTTNIDTGAINHTHLNGGASVVLSVKDSGVTTAKIANSAVTTTKIADSNVTTAKIADDNITTIKLGDLQVTNAKLASGAVTRDKFAAIGQQESSENTSAYNFTTSYSDLTNHSCNITTSGRPVLIVIEPGIGYALGGGITVKSGSSLVVKILRDSTDVCYIHTSNSSSNDLDLGHSLFYLDTPAAGTYTYKIQGIYSSGSGASSVYTKLMVYEI